MIKPNDGYNLRSDYGAYRLVDPKDTSWIKIKLEKKWKGAITEDTIWVYKDKSIGDKLIKDWNKMDGAKWKIL